MTTATLDMTAATLTLASLPPEDLRKLLEQLEGAQRLARLALRRRLAQERRQVRTKVPSRCLRS
jgi:hypothetical protein